MTAYASVDDVLRLRRQTSTDAAFLTAIERHLGDVQADLVREISWDYSRQPASGTTSWTVAGSGSDLLHAHGGIVSLTGIEIRQATGGPWIALDVEGTGWLLEAAPGDLEALEGEPYFHIRLVTGAGYSSFPRYQPAGVRLTGVRGWASIPTYARSATVAWVRQRLALDPSTAGQMGPDDLGQPTGPDRWPRQVYDLVMRERQRHYGCDL